MTGARISQLTNGEDVFVRPGCATRSGRKREARKVGLQSVVVQRKAVPCEGPSLATGCPRSVDDQSQIRSAPSSMNRTTDSNSWPSWLAESVRHRLFNRVRSTGSVQQGPFNRLFSQSQVRHSGRRIRLESGGLIDGGS